jgi:acylphosphatase
VNAPAGRPDVVRVHAVAAGRVQGVWYRESCRREAGRLGVVGQVRNTVDGAVEVDAQGPRTAVEALLRWARTGPPRAQVDRLHVEDRAPWGEPPRSFDVAW